MAATRVVVWGTGGVGSNAIRAIASSTRARMRVVNAVPHVVDAAPGLLSSLDLPVTVPTHIFEGATS